jgi:uncharacterized iron-regulated membrane protein
MGAWQQWLQQPQHLWLRKALFQVHLWAGIGAGLYICILSISGSILVYRNELYMAATPAPVIVEAVGVRLTNDQLQAAAARKYPGYQVENVYPARRSNQAVNVRLSRAGVSQYRLFDPFTGNDLGNSVARGVQFVTWLTDLHDNLLFGGTGRLVNAAGAIVWTAVGFTGLVIWWPGAGNWRRSLLLHRNVGWKRFNWDLHSAMGLWTLAFVLLFAVTGLYLADEAPFQALADYLQPPTDANVGARAVDTVTYWLAYLHFGRFGGGSTKLIWAIVGLSPVCMFVTGAVMWWNRVLSKALSDGEFRKSSDDRQLQAS